VTLVPPLPSPPLPVLPPLAVPLPPVLELPPLADTPPLLVAPPLLLAPPEPTVPPLPGLPPLLEFPPLEAGFPPVPELPGPLLEQDARIDRAHAPQKVVCAWKIRCRLLVAMVNEGSSDPSALSTSADQIAQALRGGFWRQISLGLGQELVAHHELLDGRRAKQGRVHVAMQLPVLGAGGAERRAMPTHRIRERHLEQAIVGGQQRRQQRRQIAPRRRRELRQARHRRHGQDQRLERPHCPVRNDGDPARVLVDDAIAALLLEASIVEQEG
jgi:hypothetical protein